jgi:uncharacterized surface protein with fasciclin (FAS1) repeats
MFMDQSKGTPDKEAARNNSTAPARNIIDTAIAAGNLSIFAAGVKAAGLTETLATNGPFTVFAPTDEAFKKLPTGAYDLLFRDTGKLNAILKYHVIQGYVTANDLKAGELMTQQGTTLVSTPSSSSGVRINEARVVQADLVASNGIIHAIDAVILPKNWQLTAAAA